MARYGTLEAWAKQLGHKGAVTLLDKTLAEETKTDKALTQLGGPANSAAVAKGVLRMGFPRSSMASSTS